MEYDENIHYFYEIDGVLAFDTLEHIADKMSAEAFVDYACATHIRETHIEEVLEICIVKIMCESLDDPKLCRRLCIALHERFCKNIDFRARFMQLSRKINIAALVATGELMFKSRNAKQ